MRNIKTRNIAKSILIVGLAGYCGASLAENPVYDFPKEPPKIQAPSTLEDVLKKTPAVPKEKEEGAFSFNAVHEIGQAFGMRAGLAYGSDQIIKDLEKQSEILDRIFGFQPLMMPGNVVPPVLVETTHSYDQKSSEHVVLSDVVYRIEKPAHFASVPPNWRSYLMKRHPFNPDDLGGWAPRNNSERSVWESAVKSGWSMGVEQAYQIFGANMSRLSRDITGMVLYRKLLARNMVSPPILASSVRGVTGGGQEMNINETTLVIHDRSSLKADPTLWRGR